MAKELECLLAPVPADPRIWSLALQVLDQDLDHRAKGVLAEAKP